ncbi:MAG TPA: divalent-cation tolerance protein CutA [Geminicoccaceae bacterium]|nr:divalent-cation tolerance protein CutA [Geminicoccaceae bacterium]
MSVVLVYVTCPNQETARRIARSVVEERLAACANLLGAGSSLYWWRDRLEEAPEAYLMLKTRSVLAAALVARVAELHPYACPAVVALPVVAGHAPYLAWFEAVTGEPS